jgi:hypothetical protein
MNEQRRVALAGWAGIAFIQGATLPSMIGSIMGWTQNLPPLSMVLLIWIGLALFLYRAFAHKDMVAIASNSIGWIVQSAMLAILFLRG